MKKINLITISLIIISFIIGIYSYPLLPEKIVSHWGVEGTPNKLISKFWGLFLIPIISLFLFTLFRILPKIDPLKKNLKKIDNYYDNFSLVIILFLFYIYILSMLWTFNKIIFNMTKMITPVLGFLFIYIGFILKDIKRNWFIGIRTPWTLSDDIIWKKTHDIGSKLFILSGIMTMIGLFFPKQIVWFALVPILISSGYLIVYSYFLYRKINKSKAKSSKN